MTNHTPTNDDRLASGRAFALRMVAAGGLLAGLLAFTAMSGCGGEEEPPPPPPRVTQAPPPRVDVMAGIELDPRVQWPEETHPSTPELAQSIAKLANALARADADAFADMLTPEDAMLTRELVTFGLWQKQIERVEAIRICVLNEISSSNAELGIGLQTPSGAYLIAFEGRTSSPWVFTGLGITNIEAPRVAMLDGSPLLRPQIPGKVEIIQLDDPKEPDEEELVPGSGGGGAPMGPTKPRRHFR